MIVTVVLISVLWLVVLDDRNSPESALENMIEALNNGDLETAVNCTVLKFGTEEERLQQVNEWQQYISEHDNLRMSIDSMEVTSRESIGNDEVTQTMTGLVELMETEWKVEISDYCLLSFNITETYDGGENHTGMTAAGFKIAESWYSMLYQ